MIAKVGTEEPTLGNLLGRLRNMDVVERYKMEYIFAQVASGERDPIEEPLMSNLQILACQVMVILLREVEKK